MVYKYLMHKGYFTILEDEWQQRLTTPAATELGRMIQLMKASKWGLRGYPEGPQSPSSDLGHGSSRPLNDARRPRVDVRAGV
jgi:hypothetical protein